MNLKYTGGVIGLVGFASGPFFMLGTTGSAAALEGIGLLLFGLFAITGAAGSILTLRGNSKVGGGLSLASGLCLLALGFILSKPTPWFTGGIITVGGLTAFLYKAPVMTGGQWRMRRTGTGTGTPPTAAS